MYQKSYAKYVKQKLMELKEEIAKSVILLGRANNTHWTIDGTTRQKISKDIK